MKEKNSNVFIRVLKGIGCILLALVLAVVILFSYLTVTEYRPKSKESLDVLEKDDYSKTVSPGDTLTLMTWNIGYGALGDNADFFMDGGKGVQTATEDRVNENMKGIEQGVRDINPDVAFFQEVDVNSARSHKVDEAKYLEDGFDGYTDTFATNFKVPFIPYPVPPIGKVNGGILTMTKYGIKDSTRVQLPCPFSWPYRLGNLKRCLAINRVPVEGTDKELVLVNLHLEAYDSGEGKIEQTKMLKRYLQAEADRGNYVIAAGDFNQIFSNVDGSKFPTLEGKWQAGKLDVKEFSSDWTFSMDETKASCRSLDQPLKGADKDNFQYYIIDGFITSKNVEVKSVETKDLKFKNTDHNPVVLRVSLK